MARYSFTYPSILIWTAICGTTAEPLKEVGQSLLEKLQVQHYPVLNKMGPNLDCTTAAE